MPKQPLPFSEGATTADTGETDQPHPSPEHFPIDGIEQVETHGIDAYIKTGTQTPRVGKPFGTDKPHRLKIKGKVSK